MTNNAYTILIIKDEWINAAFISNSTLRETILRVRKKIIPLVLKKIVGRGYSLQKEKN